MHRVQYSVLQDKLVFTVVFLSDGGQTELTNWSLQGFCFFSFFIFIFLRNASDPGYFLASVLITIPSG